MTLILESNYWLKGFVSLITALYCPCWTSQVAQWWRICLPMQETWVWSLSQEDPLKKGMATHSSVLACLPWTEEAGGLQSTGSQKSDMTEWLNNNNKCLWKSFSRVQLFASPWTGACQAPLSMELSRQEHWSGFPCSSPGDLPSPRTELCVPYDSCIGR